MRLQSHAAILLFAVSVATIRPAVAQVAEGFHTDPPTASRLEEEAARAKLLNWVENTGSDREQHIYFRNTSDQPIKISTYEYSDCDNVTVKCGVVYEGPLLEPGETIILERVRQRNIERRWGYRYQFTVRFQQLKPRLPAVESARGGPMAEPLPPTRRTGWTPERFAYVDQVMPMLLRNHNVPGAAIVLIEDALVQWSAGYGVAYADGPSVTPQTVFDVGSLGQPVVALTFQRLADVRGWSLEAPVSSWAFESAIPKGVGALSAASLLSHTGGVTYGAGTDEFLRVRSANRWQYSEAGYSLLRYLVETSEGHDFEVLVRALVAEPHGLASMSFVPPGSGDLARGHDRSGVELQNDVRKTGTSSPLFSSASNYARFLIEVSPLSRRDRETWRRMAHARLAVQEDIGLSWGLGWAIGKTNAGSDIVFQWNSAPGSKSLAMIDMEVERGIVIFTNGENGLELAKDVLKMLDPRTHEFLEFDMLQSVD